MTGDELIPAPQMAFDRRRTVHAPPETVWPWLVQLGKRRAGWYMTAWAERLIPPSRRAIRRIDPRWQELAVGDSVPDYGGAGETLDVARIEPPAALVYTSTRKSATFSWALLLSPEGPGATAVHLRFRGAGLRSTGVKRRLLVGGGELFDRVTSELMLSGLAERVEAAS